MATDGRRVTVDTSVFLNVLIGGEAQHPERFPAGRALFRAGERGEVVIVASAISIAEVAGAGSVRGSHLQEHERLARIARARAWMHGSGFQVVELDRNLAIAAAELGIRHQLKGADAVILASAVRTRSETLYSWDSDLLKLDGAIGGLRLLHPSPDAFDRDLFDAVEAETRSSASPPIP